MPRSCNRVAGSIAPSPCLAYRGGRYYTSWADYQNDRGNPRGVVPGGATGPGNQIGDITCYTNCGGSTPPTNSQDPTSGTQHANYGHPFERAAWVRWWYIHGNPLDPSGAACTDWNCAYQYMQGMELWNQALAAAAVEGELDRLVNPCKYSDSCLLRNDLRQLATPAGLVELGLASCAVIAGLAGQEEVAGPCAAGAYGTALFNTASDVAVGKCGVQISVDIGSIGAGKLLGKLGEINAQFGTRWQAFYSGQGIVVFNGASMSGGLCK
jgi:hypothetical protein